MPLKEKAAGRAPKAATNTTRDPLYASPRVASSQIPAETHRDLRQPPAAEPQRVSTDGAALGLLILLLQRRGLPAIVRRHGWGLVERWTRQLVDAHLTGETA